MTNPTPPTEPLSAESICYYQHLPKWFQPFTVDGGQIDQLALRHLIDSLITQETAAYMPLAAWAKKHGHSLECDLRKNMGNPNVDNHCDCGWAAAHNRSELTTNQHLALADYGDKHYDNI